MKHSMHRKGEPIPPGKKRVVFDFVMRGRVAAFVNEGRVAELVDGDMAATEDDLEREFGIWFDPSDYTDNADEIEFTDARVDTSMEKKGERT